MAAKVLVKKPSKLTIKKGTAPAAKKKEVATSPALQSKTARVMKATSAKRASAPAKKTTPAKVDKGNGIYSRADAKKRVGNITFEKLANLTGFKMESDQFVVAVEIMKGGVTRQEINHRVKDILPPTTRTGTPKAVSNLVSAVVNKMADQGFQVEGSWKMISPS